MGARPLPLQSSGQRKQAQGGRDRAERGDASSYLLVVRGRYGRGAQGYSQISSLYH